MKVGNEMELGGFQAAALFTLLIQSVEVSVEGKTRINCTLAFKSLCAIDFFFFLNFNAEGNPTALIESAAIVIRPFSQK